MKKLLSFTSLVLMMLICSVSANAQSVIRTITKVAGWIESGYIEWESTDVANDNVFYRAKGETLWIPLDRELHRQYNGYCRADIVGLTAGEYEVKVENNAQESVIKTFTAVAADRSGFAHYGRSDGVGAYNNDGTLKTDARILYVTAANARTVSLDMKVSATKTETRTGLQNIIQAYEKSAETRPLAIRIIGTIKATDMDEFGSSAEGLQVKGGGSAKCNAQLTIEGIGDDAVIHGFGVLCRAISSVEFRNFAIMMCMDDCLSIDTDNKNIWVHNMDFFYGQPGSDSDQTKGDGTVDIKGKSSHVTVSYCHFYDSGKCSLGGMKSETTDCWMTYHHNWFDHSDSRHPRIRTAFYHVYNNYFDGNAKYGTGVTMGGSAFCESNYYRNTKYPFLSSKQGTDAQGDGTFSGENGGVIKTYNNKVINPKQILYYDGKQSDGAWDAVEATSREEDITATAYVGGTAYNNDATTVAIAAVPASAIDNPADVAAICRGDKSGRPGAGRIEGGDFRWTFKYTTQDTNGNVIADMKQALIDYKSTLVAYGDGTDALNAGGTRVDGGDGKGVTQSYGEDTPKPLYSGDTPDPEPVEGNVIFEYFKHVGNTTLVSTATADMVKASTVKINSNKNSVSCIYYGKSAVYSDGIISDYYAKITPANGIFRAGDQVTIAGAYNNKAEKTATIRVLGAASDSIFNTRQMVNGQLSADNPIDETFILSKDEECLYLVRSGNTGTNITKLIVKRPEITAIKDVFTDTPADTRKYATKYIGKGKIVISRNGKGYNTFGVMVY